METMVFLYFPTPLKSLPRPAEVLQKKTESDEARRLPERDLAKLAKGGGNFRRLPPIFPGESGVREGRRLLLEETWGKLGEGCGDYSWERARRRNFGKFVRKSREVIDTFCKEYLAGASEDRSGGKSTTYCPRKTAETIAIIAKGRRPSPSRSRWTGGESAGPSDDGLGFRV